MLRLRVLCGSAGALLQHALHRCGSVGRTVAVDRAAQLAHQALRQAWPTAPAAIRNRQGSNADAEAYRATAPGFLGKGKEQERHRQSWREGKTSFRLEQSLYKEWLSGVHPKV
jgi:hypothetical protein